MSNNPSTSLLTILALYGKLRHSGTSKADTLEKLRGLAVQLSPHDRRELERGINDWEAKQGGKADNSALSSNRQTGEMPPISEHAFGISEYDLYSNENKATLAPLHPFIACPHCGKKIDATALTCPHCGKVLVTGALVQPDNIDPQFFGLASKLLLGINGAQGLLEVSVRGVVTFGRHTPDNTTADIDLTKYGAAQLGVSRMHASIKRQGTKLTLTDMGSLNHTMLNGQELQDGEVRTLKSGDEIYLGKLGFSILYKHISRA